MLKYPRTDFHKQLLIKTMAKQSNQKLKLLYLLKILYEQTDEESGLTLAQISAELAKYGISAARKSLYDDIESLRVFGIEVGVKRDRYVRYFMARRDISFVELKYISDALAGFDALPPSASYELLQKLIRIWSIKERSRFSLTDEPIYKTPKSVYQEQAKSIDALSLAISHGKKISCKEFSWNALKQRIVLNEGRRIVLTPIRIICDNNYTLCAFDGKHICAYRVERLLDVEILNESAAPQSEYSEMLAANRDRLEYENLRLECSAVFAGDIFEKFGLGVTVLSSREDSFEISVKARLDDCFYAWLFNNARYVRVISPERVRDDLKQRLLLALDNIEREPRA